ncbi:MAG: NYN domain-containing protein [Verrucomicrobiota bacterium JB023]|nr:NYN domain-containing protein [Verrucomicrobiota bacterium JB023]
MSQPLLIVDGHNAIFGLERFGQHGSRFSELTRSELVDWISRYQTVTDYATVIVFDGKGRKRSSVGGSEGDALVIYSASGESADAVIEQLAIGQAAKRRVLVASNDRLVAHGIMDAGAEPIHLEMLEDMVESALQDWRRAHQVRTS